MNVNLQNYKNSFVNSFVLLVIGLLTLTLLSSFAHATEAGAEITSVTGRKLVTVVDANGNIQVNCNSLNKYERFKCYEDVARRKAAIQANATVEANTEVEVNQARPMMRNLGQEIKDQCSGQTGRNRVMCVDMQIIKKRLGVAVAANARLDNAFEKLADDKEKMFKDKMRMRFGNEDKAKGEFQRLLGAYNDKAAKLKDLHDRIALLRVKASLTAEEKMEFASKLDDAFIKGVEARIDLAYELETQGLDSEKVAKIVAFLQEQEVKFKAATSISEKKEIVIFTNSQWLEFKQDMGKTFFTGKIEVQAFRIKAVLEKADNTTAQLKADGKDVSKLEVISLRAHEHVEIALGSNLTLRNSAWHLARARVWTNYYLQSINRIVNGKSLEREPNDQPELVAQSQNDVHVNLDEDSSETSVEVNSTVEVNETVEDEE